MEKERVPFCEFMYPKGNVENWLGEVERIMRASVRQSYIDSNAAYCAEVWLHLLTLAMYHPNSVLTLFVTQS